MAQIDDYGSINWLAVLSDKVPGYAEEELIENIGLLNRCIRNIDMCLESGEYGLDIPSKAAYSVSLRQKAQIPALHLVDLEAVNIREFVRILPRYTEYELISLRKVVSVVALFMQMYKDSKEYEPELLQKYLTI